MLISLVNFTRIPDSEIQRVVRAINRQIRDDFEPYWNWSGTLRLEGRMGAKPVGVEKFPEELRGEAILYLSDQIQSDDTLGYHDQNFCGLPYGFVSTKLAAELNEQWSVTLSHEALELIGDASANCFAAGPHPKHPERTVFHWYEMCDAVQDDSYEIDGVGVSNFVLPLYFTPNNERGARNDFLGATGRKGERLASFGVRPGGYIGFFDPRTGKDGSYEIPGDRRAAERRRIKEQVGRARRTARHALRAK